MFSALLITMALMFCLFIFAIVAVVGSIFKLAWGIVWIPLKIVGVLVASVVFLAVGLPLMVVALPVLLVLCVVALPFMIIGGIFWGGLSLVGLT